MGRPEPDIVEAGTAWRLWGTTGIAATSRIATRAGHIAAIALRPGDALLTRDSGYCPLRALDVIGPLPCRRLGGLWLRPGHGVALRRADGKEALVPARDLADPGAPLPRLVVSLRFDRHEVILAEGSWIESAPVAGRPARPRRLLEGTAVHMRKIRVAGGNGWG